MIDIQARIVEYLDLGGFFNPEAMNHEQVRTLIMDAADEICRLRARLAEVSSPATPQLDDDFMPWPTKGGIDLDIVANRYLANNGWGESRSVELVSLLLTYAVKLRGEIAQLLEGAASPATPQEHFCVLCHHRWSGDGLSEHCGDCHRAFLEMKAAPHDD